MEKQKNSVGRRKEAVTRVFISRGSGKITVNDKDYKTYFPLVYLQNQVELPLKTIEASDKFDVKINATGGGVKGQAEAAARDRDARRSTSPRSTTGSTGWRGSCPRTGCRRSL
mgnify:CR=1 FL=1